MHVLTHGNIDAGARDQIEAEVLNQKNLADMMNWALTQTKGTFIPQVVLDVIIQDEFTHDVIVPRNDGLVLVYDTT